MTENRSIFLIDFDVTISRKDSTDTLLETHNPEYKKIIREKYKNGDITMREFVIFGLESLNITREEYIATLDKNVTIDESFKKEAVESYQKKGYKVIFVGDGPSDYRAMETADFVFVRKGTRAVKFCLEENIDFLEFDNFNEILEWRENQK